MGQNLIAKVKVTVNVPTNKVWEALTDPELIKQYLFGTEVVTNWKVGSPIIWKGVWQGKTYEDKGEILRMIPEKLLETTYWSGMAGLPDKPENYKKVTYELMEENGNTKLILTQDNNSTEEDKNRSEQNWKVVLGGLKKLLEK
jgi:uncharacterized protein YndB with AHSA1/START domain